MEKTLFTRHAMTFDAFKTKYASSLTDQQLAALRSAEGPVLLLAVPGSGKTTVLVLRLGYLILCRGVAPENILTMTYTVSAAKDMKERFAAIFGEDLAGRLEFRTINGVCARIIRLYEQRWGRKAFDLLSDEGECAGLIRQLYRDITQDFPTDGDIKAIQSAIAYAKNEMLNAEGIEDLGKTVDHFPALYRAYNETLRARFLMDYDDQMVYALAILRRCPDILDLLRRRWTYLYVDEAQDTSRIQHTIIDLLSTGNLFLVGDEDQSIYGFRAACPQALLNFEKNHPGARVLLMETNFRSAAPIVAAADRFIRLNASRHPKTMVPARSGGKAVREIPLRDRRAQYRYLLKVAQNCSQETAVLYRDNDCALPLIDLLERNNIPYRKRQSDLTFFSNRVTRDLTDILRLSLVPDDREAFLRVYYKFGAGITRQAAEHAARFCPAGESLFAYLTDLEGLSDYAKMKSKALHTHLEHMRTERGDKAVYRIVHFMGYGDYLEERGADTSRTSILESLGEQEPSPARLLERLTELQSILQQSGTSDSPFLLSTIHSAKGLEYETVYLLDVADGILPKEGDDVDTEEERRLFYVGMTRAKEELNVFTFQSPSLSSSFSDCLFPKSPAAPIRPLSREFSARRASVRQVSAEEFYPGRAVLHKKFGPGRIVAREGDILTLRLEDGMEKRFSLSVALRSGALSFQQN